MSDIDQTSATPSAPIIPAPAIPAPAAPSPDIATQLAALWPLIVLVALSDVLFYGQSVGISLAVFAVALLGGATFVAGKRALVRPLGILALSILPVIDHLQPLSVAILLAGLCVSLASLYPGSGLVRAGAAIALGLVRRAPVDAVRAVIRIAATSGSEGLARRLLRNWGFPVLGALVLIWLLSDANPVLSDWLDSLTTFELDPIAAVQRFSFWLLLIWPVWGALVARPLSQVPRAAKAPKAWTLGLTATAVGNALLVFNLILGVQNVLDAVCLWTGAALPPGMTMATYVHRGAYPLLATALLAGAFALVARPFLAAQSRLKPLLLLWIGQNVVLALSAAFRLDLYVGAFGLTYLRIYAVIWMLLAAFVLALTLVQVAAGKSNFWLLVRRFGAAGVTLYLCAFVNFAALIARYDVQTTDPDWAYICDLGPTAAAELLHQYPTQCDHGVEFPVWEGWRDWGYRNWSVNQVLQSQIAT